MKKAIVLNRKKDPISLEAEKGGFRGNIFLRIGDDAEPEERGSRVSELSPREARKLALALLQAAEQEE